MTVKNTLAAITRLGAVAALATGLAVAVQPAAMAAPAAAAVTVTPATGLSDNQQVTVTGTGLTPGTVYHVGQCAVVAPNTFGCDKATSLDVVADAQGKVTAQLRVHVSFAAVVGASATPWGTVDAKATPTQVGLGSDSGEGGGQLISFK
ncbi:enediyne antibiotic chromoprotein [Streptomyces goshikiensis]|uniref:enediyne antibiotic chromoprotein n=1 Tax=Streptomyces goshikiensis TaxID=1942 RepID=UPI0036BF85BB